MQRKCSLSNEKSLTYYHALHHVLKWDLLFYTYGHIPPCSTLIYQNVSCDVKNESINIAAITRVLTLSRLSSNLLTPLVTLVHNFFFTFWNGVTDIVSNILQFLHAYSGVVARKINKAMQSEAERFLARLTKKENRNFAKLLFTSITTQIIAQFYFYFIFYFFSSSTLVDIA